MSNKVFYSKKSYDDFLLSLKDVKIQHIDFELTERCNNNCVHCYINQPPGSICHKKKELSTPSIQNILAEAASLGAMSVRFTGGEPLLREDFVEIYTYARQIGLSVTLFTNATLITDNIAKLFSDIPPKNNIEITVYGMSKETYESVSRTIGSFKAAFSGIERLLNFNIPFIVKGAYLPQNKREFHSFETWAASLEHMNGNLPDFSMFFDLRCRRDSEKKNAKINRLRPTTREALEFFQKRKDSFASQIRSFCIKFSGIQGMKLFNCGACMASSITIDSYGTIFPCQLLRHPQISYDLSLGSFQDAIVSFFPKINGMMASNYEYQKRCAKCFLKSLCKQCAARSWIEHGILDIPVEYHCEITHLQARFINLLGRYEKTWDVEDWKDRIVQLAKGSF